mgnify:CR=1 FL=1
MAQFGTICIIFYFGSKWSSRPQNSFVDENFRHELIRRKWETAIRVSFRPPGGCSGKLDTARRRDKAVEGTVVLI